MIEWRIKGREFTNCNCSYGCPCQFSALPTHGRCEAVMGYVIDEGHFGAVRLDGLRAAVMYRWPGAVHEGDGAMQLVVDARADAEQRAALLAIMRGEETEPMKTMWSVYTHMVTTEHEPIFAPIDFAVDIERRTARLKVDGVIEAEGAPIRHIVTGEPHRARIDLPHGIEYRIAEIGSGTSRTRGPIDLDLAATYSQFAEINLSNAGVVTGGARGKGA